jgi:hypothetical protein
MRNRIHIAALIVLALPAVALAGDQQTHWLHVAVEDGSDRVRVNVPMNVVSAALPLIEDEHMSGGKVRIDDFDMDPEDIVAFLRAVRDAEDGEYVNVEDRHDRVKVSKQGEYLWVRVHEDWDEADAEETVVVKMPIEVLSALVSGEDDELDVMAALDVLSRYEGEDLVTVNDEGTSVRIWVDRENQSATPSGD